MTARAQQLAVQLRDVGLDADSGRAQHAGKVLPLAWLEAIAEHLVDDLGWTPPDVVAEIIDDLTASLAASERHRHELEAAVDRVRRLHDQDDSTLARGSWCPADGQPEPCKTTLALNGKSRPPG